ncbi:MAG: NAD(P)-binding protein [Planctomycetota bacterium]
MDEAASLSGGHWRDGLPEHLGERCHALNERGVDAGGDFVVCWLHHAVRDHENPALDVAVTLGNALSKPVLVYQGLGGAHRYNSDRHHVFIMQGARDLQRGLAERGIAYAFWLPRDPGEASPLRELVGRACAVVTEDYPVPPMPRWSAAMAARSVVAMVAVDSACVMPVRWLGERHTRAFKFRDKAKKQWRSRIGRTWVDVEPAVGALDVGVSGLGFEAVDLQGADLGELAAGCAIDHATPPVGRIEGGMAGGHARWEAFKAEGLGRYDKVRNNALKMDAVSGLSPWLHHGHVSPLRVAREAKAMGGSGAEKFLDELLTWRELAFNFCVHTEEGELESLRALPGWARQTLEDHAKDERAAVYSWDTMRHAATGDALWDAAQRSLLRNGELHNNVRMTWGKALTEWTADPAEALALLIDLNHRDALDGSDPNSYGGLLWCLGQFDRPFPPGRAVTGELRERTTAVHAKRLDPGKYAAAVAERGAYEPMRVAVVGAGVTGLTCARALAAQGCAVEVFDRGRRVDGRMGSRRVTVDGVGDAVLDHGLPWVEVTDARFGRHVRSWVRDGAAELWRPRRGVWREGEVSEAAGGRAVVVGVPTMNSIAAHLAEGVSVRSGAVVEGIERVGEAWALTVDGEDGERVGGYDAVVVAMSATQAGRLTAGLSDAVDAAVACVREAPTWVGMGVVEGGLGGLPDVVDVEGHGVLAKVIVDDRRPSREGMGAGRSAVVVHAGAGWSAERYEMPREEVAGLLSAALGAFLGGVVGEASVVSMAAHRWGLARAVEAADVSCAWDAGLRLAVCGDGFGGCGVEAAFLSGQAAAGRVLGCRARRETGRVEAAGTLF